jgi:hypothetical protein
VNQPSVKTDYCCTMWTLDDIPHLTTELPCFSGCCRANITVYPGPPAAGAVGAAGAVFRWMGMTRAEMMSAMRSSGGDGADFLTEAISK